MAKYILCLLALVSLDAAFGQSCGKTEIAMRSIGKPGQRIVGGQEAKPHSHPWIVSMQSFGSHFCGGSLINTGNPKQSNIVVTAAHCVYEGSRYVKVAAGAHDLSNGAVGQQEAEVETVIYHPQYNPDTTMNDIAVLKLKTPIKFSDTVKPVCLPAHGEQLADNSQAVVAGWGLTKEGGEDTSNVLMQVGIPTIKYSDCSTMYKKAKINIDQQAMICGGYKEGGKDSCQGDSGGPFVFKNGDSYTLHGVVSFGIGCARPGYPGIYARVSNYIPWIQEKNRRVD